MMRIQRFTFAASLVTLLVGVAPARLHAQSAQDGFNPGANAAALSVAVQPDGKILVGGGFTSLGFGGTGPTRKFLGRLLADGLVDTAFNPGADAAVHALTVQADGKVLVGGRFTGLGGGTGTTPRNYLGRLNVDGSVEAGFNPGANGVVSAFALQPDGKILVVGEFTTMGGGGTGSEPRNHIGRLNADGSLDASFNPGANGDVLALALQPDGKILVGGSFTMLGGGGTGTTARNSIGRLNADGSLDAGFNPGANTTVITLAVQPDGKILVGGSFTMLGGGGTGTSPRNYIGRLTAGGALDSGFDPGANNFVRVSALQSDGKILIGGPFTMLGGGGTGATARNSIGRLHADGSLDASFNPGANATLQNNGLAVQADGKILMAGNFTMLGGGGTGTTTRNYIGRLHGNGSLDADFDTGANWGTACCAGGQTVYAVAVQPDGKILVGGSFTALGNPTNGSTTLNNIGRLNVDGTVDLTFSPGANGAVLALAVQPDGKILVGGGFTTLGGGGTGTTARNFIGRLNSDGSLDGTFDPGANGAVRTFATLAGLHILVGGDFTTLGGGGTGTATRNRLGRLDATGAVQAFNPGANGSVYALVVQPDGQILVGGTFTGLGGGTGSTTRNYLGRVNAVGSLDASFDPGANNGVNAIAVQTDAKILLGGAFTTLGGGGTGTTTRSRIGRLAADGSLDGAFNPGAGGVSPEVFALAVQTDGKILVGGTFTGLGGGTGTTPRNFIGRLSPDGAVDATFSFGASANAQVNALTLQADGRILVGGYFTVLGFSGSRYRIGRLTNPQAAIQSLSVTCAGCGPGTQVTPQLRWTRTGGAPEVTRVTFETSADGVTYAATGSATRVGVTSGWQGGAVLSSNQNTLIRARGYYATGFENGSGSIVESIRQVYISCPVIAPTPLGPGTVGLAYAATFTAPNAVGVVTFSTTSALPPGVTLSSAGVLAGPPTEAGTFPLTVTATDDSSGCAGSRAETLTINPATGPTITLSPSSLPSGTVGTAYPSTPITQSGGTDPATFAVTSGALPAGLTLSSGGTLSGTPTAAGTFSLAVRATDANTFTGTRGYALTINPAAVPTMALDRTSLRFGAVTTGAAFVSQTAAQIVRLTQSGAGTVTWTATPSQPWLQVSPASGSGSANLSVSVVPVPGLVVGSPLAGAISLTLTGASNTTGPITVTLSLIQDGTSANPFGVVDTPVDNSTGVTGAIPFTGWALDDVEVTRVMVCRAAFGTEVAPVDPNCGGRAQIFVGFGVFIDGARPDVQQAYPTYPLNTKAGWGLMVLTNMLPSQGNGTYVFSMYVEDRDGHMLLLGTRTIVCANASATKPFGAIDTPTQGGSASGASFVNFGWALTPQPKLIPLDGSTFSVVIDGTPIGAVNYNHERSDIETLFPGFQNTAGANGAIGFRVIDTTALTNGVHTIAWVVTDNQGAADGIGSRYFTVSNGAGAPLTAVDGAASSRAAPTADDVATAPRDDTPVLGRRGWDLEGAWRRYGVGRAGRAVIRGEEIDRFELALGETAGAHYTGFLRAGGELAPLPVGSHLDASTGQFTWAPGVGFVGAYDLVFVRWEGTRAVARHEMRVILAPKGSGHVGVQVAIDTPRSQQDVGQPFVLAGWAADLDAATGTGIDTLHVWAYPLTGGAPVFLGTPTLGGVRPDVAAVHGDRFREVGFTLPVQGLTPGTYDLALFPWSNVTGSFAPAKVVPVTVR